MPVFGGPAGAEPWPVDVLTLDYLVSGQVEPADQQWGWSYWSMTEKTSPRELRVAVSRVSPTGSLPAPSTWLGTTASFAFATGLVALISRGDAANRAWQQWSTAAGAPVSAEVLVGPYRLSGSVLSPDGSLSVLVNDRIAVWNATITRVDGRGDDTVITVPCGVAHHIVRANGRCVADLASTDREPLSRDPGHPGGSDVGRTGRAAPGSVVVQAMS